MKIGDLARQTGMAASAIRFYESRGLLSKVRRGANGYRDYPARMRREVVFIAMSRHLGGGLDELTLTTNGSQLARFADELAECGVRRVNVSLDTLDAGRFATLTRRGQLAPVLEGIAAARARIAAFNPELVVLFAPDHYNGFFYDVMPPFCLGIGATSIGDFSSASGVLPVPTALAEACAHAVIKDGIDLAVSYCMQVDHGFAQPLEELTGSLTRYPVIPLFINSVAPPVVSFRRARQFGEAVGEFARQQGKRVLFIGSGGLSHNPPVPQMATATAEVAERLIAGRNPSPEARDARQQIGRAHV